MSKHIDRITSHHLRDTETATGAVQATSAESPARKERAAGQRGVRGYRHMRRFAAILIAAACLLGLAATSFADYDPTAASFTSSIKRRTSGGSTTSDNTDGVYQGTDKTTFGSPMVLSTIYIDMSKIKGADNEKNAVGKILSDDPGFKIADTSRGDTNFAVYDPTAAGAHKEVLRADQLNDFSGELFQFTYKDAAVLSDGTRADVRFIYSNAHAAVDVRCYTKKTIAGTTQQEVVPYTYNGLFGFARGHKVMPIIYDGKDYGNALTASELALTGHDNAEVQPMISAGLEIDVRIQVVDKQGNPIEGTFINPITGINQRKTTAKSNRPLYNTVGHEYYSEGVRINSGNVSDVYTMGYSAADPYYCISYKQIEGAYEGATRFWAGNYQTNGSNGGNGNYNSGFITTANSKSGISLTVTSGGNGSSGFNESYFLEGDPIWHRIRSVTGPGGNIQTTTEANAGVAGTEGDYGKLNDKGDILDPGTYVVPDGKTVVYTMTPDKGYVLNELRLNNSITNTPTVVAGVADMAAGDTKEVDLQQGRKAKITKNADGSYTCEFPKNNYDHTIMVNWVPDTDSVMVEATKKWYDKNNEFGTRKDILLHVNGMSEYDSGESHYYPVDFLPAQKFAPGSVADGNDDWTARWGDGEKNDHAYTGAVNGEPVYKTKEALPQVVGGKTQYYFYDYAKRQFRAYTYNETSGEFEATDTYYWVNFLPKYDESGKQIIYTVEEEVPDGYELTVKTNNRGSASDTLGDFDYTFNNTLEPIGTVKVKATKALEGRPFNGNDEFIFVLAGKHGTPMPVGTPVKIPSKGEDTPVQVAQTIKRTAGTVLAEVDFGVISYRKSNLTKNKIKYADATDEQKNAVRYWTVKDSQTASENRTYDMLDSADKTAFNNLATEVRNEATGNTYEKVFYYNITENPKHPDYVENDTSVLNMTVRVVYNELENKIYVEDEDTTDTKNGVQDITAEKNNHLTNPDVTLHRDFFINKYDNKTTWDPEITKTLNGRPISKDQFKDYFTIKADDTPESILGQVKDTVAKEDTPMPNKAYGGEKTSNRQEIEKTTAVPKGTNDVKAIVGFDTITYTNDDLLKEVSYSTSEAIRNQVIRWHKGNKVYGPIPADAEASVTKADGSKGTVKYDEATEAQRKEVEETEATDWTKDGKTYIDLNTMSDNERAAALAGSTGFYYMNERVFTYKIWEHGPDTPGYEVDKARDTEAEAYIVKVTVTRDNATGKITATPNMTKDQLKFENKYKAETEIELTGSKVLSGRDLQEDEFSFTISAVTQNAPLPTNTTVQNQADGTINFGNIKFTQNDLKVNKGDNPGAYDAVRTVDGFYEKTFVYEIKETAPASDGSGITRDKSTKTIAITVREDNEGNFKVVAVNGTTAGDADRKISFTDNSVNFGEFNNDYEASGSDTVDATKTLKGGLLKAGDFHFQLVDSPLGNVLGTTANAENGAISFPVAYNLSQVKADAEAGLCTYDDEAKTWTYTYKIKELQTDNRGDEKITYDATGIGDGYEVTVVVKDNGDGTLDIKPSTDSTAVTFINTVSTRDLTLQKIWVDNDADGISKVTRPETVTLTVTADVKDANILSSAEGTEVTKGWTLEDGKSTKDFTLTEADDKKADALWNKTLEGLPRYKADGTAIKYTVDELEANVPVNYEKTSVVTAGSTTTVINTYTITKITGTKVWVDGGLKHAISADLDGKLTVKWTDAGRASGTIEDPHIDYDNALSSYTVIGLPKYSDNGKLRTYWVEETKLDNYKVPEYTNTGDYAGKTDGAYDGGTITNKITGKIDVTGTKTWKNEDNKKPTLIPPVISLHRQSKKPGASEETAGQGDWSATPKWNEEQTEYTFEEQDKYDEDGYEYTYWVTEETVDGYLPPQYSSGDRAYNEGNITNVKEPTGELNIPVIKVLTGSTRLSDWAGKFRLGLYTGTNGTGTPIENKVTVPDTGVLAADGQSESASVLFSGLYFRIINDNGTLKAQLRSKDNLTGEDEYVDLTKNDDGTYGIKLYIHEDKITENNTGLTQPANDTEVNIILIDNNDGALTVKTTDNVSAGDVIKDNYDDTVIAERLQDSYIVENDHTQKIDAEIAIKKILNGRDIKSTDNFTFTATYQPDTTLAENERLRLNEGLDAKTKDLALRAMESGESTVDATHPQGVGGEVNASTGTVKFTFDKTGTYKFKVTESGSNAGVTNDDKATTGEEVIVVIVKDTDGKLKVASTTYADGTDADFTNTYDAKGDATVQVRKIVSGADWGEDMAFWFDLQPKTAPAGYTTATMPKPAVRYEAAYNKTGRTATWNLSEFKLADAGKEFIYSVQEQEPTFTGYVANEWVNDKSVHTIKIVPKDKGDGTLSFDIYYDSDTKPEFQPMAITNRKKGTSINVFASKEVVDRNGDPYWPDGLGGFELVFTAVTPGAPMPSGAEGGVKKLTAENATRQNFGLIDFDAAYEELDPGRSKTFTYTFTETVDATKDYIDWGIDNTDTYTVEVTIAKDADGNIIDPVRVRKNSAGEVVSSDGYPVIKNEYTAKGEIDLEATKVLQGRVLENQQFSFTLYDNEGNPLYRDAEGYITKDADDGEGHDNTPITAKNDASGKVALGKFKYTDADAAAAPITYVLREDLPTGVTPANPTKDGYTYDTAAHPIVITMTDNGEGTLDVSADTANTEASGKKRLTVTNKYEAKGTQTFEVYKYLEERPIRRVGFTFNLKATGDDADVTPMPGGAKGGEATTQVLPSATYAHDGTAAFGDIVYTMDDLKKMVDDDSNPETPDVWDGTYETKTFTYEIKEVVPEGVVPDGKTDGLTYAKTIYTATVEVEDNGDGTLKVTPVYTKESGEDSKYGDNANNAKDAEYGANGTVDFTNIYDADGEANLNAIKEVHGRSWHEDDEFTFLIEPYEGSDIYSYTGGQMKPDNKVDKTNVPLPGNTIDPTNRKASGNSTGTGGNMNDDGQYEAKVTIDGAEVGKYGRQAFIDAINITDDMLTYDPADGYLKGTFFYKITEDADALENTGFVQTPGTTTTYYARVDVVDDRMGNIEFSSALYYTDPSKLDDVTKHIGTSPVFQNTYDADGQATIPVKKFVDITGVQDGGWTNLQDSDEFTFAIAPVGNAPAMSSDTITIKKSDEGHTKSFATPEKGIKLEDLVLTTANKGDLKYSDGTTEVDKDVAYAEFIYQISENDHDVKGVDKDENLIFAKVIAIDHLDGTIDTQVKYYSDATCTTEITQRIANPSDAEFVNIYRDVMNVVVQKAWFDGDKPDADRPAIKIALTRKIEGGNLEILDHLDGNAKLVANDGTTAITYASGEATISATQLPVTFTNLPATDKDGNAYIYMVDETDAGAGYFESEDVEVVQEGAMDDPETQEYEYEDRILKLTNTKTTKVTVAKLWKDEHDSTHRGTVIVAALYKNGVLLPNNIQLVQKDSDPEWTTTFDNLPMYDKNGLINYTAKEMAVPEEYYTSLVEYSLDSGDAADWQTDQSKLNGGVDTWNTDDHKFIQITNVLLTTLDVEKKWDGIPTDNVTYELYRTTDAEIVAAPTKGIVEDPETGLKNWTPDNKWEKVMESDGTTPRSHIFTTDEFYYADGENIPDGKKAGDLRDEPVKYTFTDLERYDKEGNKYVYRVYEITEGKYFDKDQDSNVKITNINKYTGQGKAKPNVVKELTGRRWNDDDKFYFMIEPIKGINDDGTPIDFDKDSDEDQAAKAKVPLPKDADGDGKPDVIAETDKTKKRVGEIGRSVDFEEITFVSGDDDTANVKEGGFEDYFYKIYEVDKDGNPIGGKTIDGITYTEDVHTLRINLSDDGLGGEKSITTQRYWDGSDTSSAVPVYVNRYKAYGISYGYVIKRIAGREFEEGDEFTFEFTNLSGSPVRREGPDATGKTDPVTGTVDPVGYADDEGVYVSGSAGKYDATGEKHGSDKAQEVGVNYINSGDLVAGADGILRGTFVYEFRELGGHAGDTVSKVPDLEYDDNLIYLQVKVTDNEDGTLKVEHKYYLDAACTKPLAGREQMEPMLLVDLETGDIAPAGAQRGTHVVTEGESTDPNSPYYDMEPGAEITYGYVASGYFRNRLKIDIPIAKKWVDEEGNITDPVDNVTVKLLRYPIFVDDEGNYWEDAAHKKPATLPDDEAHWEFVSSHVFEVGDFYYKDGDAIPAGKKVGDLKDDPVNSKFEGVDLYEHNDADGVPTGKQYIYRVLEANSSSSYETTYRMGSSTEEKEWTETDTQGQDDKKQPVVVNKITATNKANIATVKQLVGRDWLSNDYAGSEVDRYKFILAPVGRGRYGANGQLVKQDGKVQMDKDVGTNIPMPDSVISSELDPVNEKNKAMAANWTEYASGEPRAQEIVGEGERLARFGSIEYKLDDLVYNSKDGHMQGDFFYILKEEIPNNAIALDKHTGKPVDDAPDYEHATEDQKQQYNWEADGVTYDSKEHTVHVRVRENRTNELIVQVGYDEKTEGDASTGTQFAPVFTNHYAATGDKAVSIDKKIMGRKWKEGDKLDFTMQALGGAPFNDAHPYVDGSPGEEFADPTADRRTSLDSGLAIHNDDGTEHVKRLIITASDAGNTETKSLVMPGLAYKLSDLGKTTTVSGQYKYSGKDGRDVPAGTKYDEFMYAIEEEELYPDDYPKDLELDKEPEYAKIIVIDKGNGELDFQIKIYEDRFGRNQRATDGTTYHEGTTQIPATHATFVNQAKRDIKVTKTWKGDLAEDVKIILQRRIPPEDPDDPDDKESGWEDYDTWTLSSKASPTTPLKEETVNGVRLKVAEYEHTFESIPVYGDDGNDINANDSQLQWRIVEEQTATEGMKTYYGVARPDDSEAAVTEEDAPTTDGYSDTADVAKDETIDNVDTFVEHLDDKLYVTNVNAPEIKPATAKVSGVKDIKGRDWKDDEFEFKLTAVGIGTYTDGKLNVNEDGKVDRETLKEDDEGHVITDIPMPDSTTAIAKEDETHPDYELSDSQWQTYFGDITIEAADVDFVKVDGKDVLMGDFFYDMTEVIPAAALAFDKATGEQIVIEGRPLTYEGATPEQKASPDINWIHVNMTYDTRSHEVHVHVERTGNHLVATVSYDGKDVGGAVPVFTNRYKTTDSVEVHVMKKWDDSKDQDDKRPDSVTVNLKANGQAAKDTKGHDVAAMTLNEDNNWKSAFKNLPKTDNKGKSINYTVEETAVTAYKTKYEYQSAADSKWYAEKPADWNNKILITNSYTPEVQNVTARKVWAGETTEVGTSLRSDIILHLYGKNADGLVVCDAGTKKIAKDTQAGDYANRKVTWTNIPKRHFSNKDLTWEVTEEPIYGYTTKVTGNITDGFTVTNTYAEPVTKVTAKKTWEDNNYKDRPKNVTFELWRKVGDKPEEKVTGKDQTVSATPISEGIPAWTAVWKNLPVADKVETGTTTENERVEYKDVQKTDEQGNYIYKLIETDEEVAVSENLKETYDNDVRYEAVMIQKPVKEKETVKDTKEVPVLYMVKERAIDTSLGYEEPIYKITKPGEFEIVNTRKVDMVRYQVKKIWNDENDKDKIRPDHVTVRLKHGGNLVEKLTLDENDKTAEDENVWTAAFKEVPKYSEDGVEIEYEVTEDEVDGYTKVIVPTTPEPASGPEITVTNTHAAGRQMKLTAIKVWDGDGEDKSHRTDKVTFHLIKVVEGARKDIGQESIIVDKETEPGKPAGSFTWENLPTIEKGKDVSYTVEEEPIAGYAATYSDVTRKEAAPKEGDNPKEKGWFEKVDDKYVPTKDETVVPNKTYYTDEYEVTVKNTFNSGGGELSGDVLYVDPKNEAGKMIVKSDRYGTKNQAESAAEKQKDKPADPSHAGYNFLGWALNKDEHDNWVLVATYSEVAPTVKKITTYIDPQSGKVMLVSGESGTIKKPAKPKHDGMIFVKWVKSIDAAGNTIYVAKFKCAAKGSSTSAPPKTYSQREQNLQRVTVVDTGDGAQLPLMVLFLTASGAFAAAVIIRRRREDARRDDAA